jgi:hypothetical protein
VPGQETAVADVPERTAPIACRVDHRRSRQTPALEPGTSLEWTQEKIEKYSRNSPWGASKHIGRFSPSSLNTLIGPDERRDAIKCTRRPPTVEAPLSEPCAT